MIGPIGGQSYVEDGSIWSKGWIHLVAIVVGDLNGLGRCHVHNVNMKAANRVGGDRQRCAVRRPAESLDPSAESSELPIFLVPARPEPEFVRSGFVRDIGDAIAVRGTGWLEPGQVADTTHTGGQLPHPVAINFDFPDFLTTVLTGNKPDTATIRRPVQRFVACRSRHLQKVIN